eukprot:gene16710-8161_t
MTKCHDGQSNMLFGGPVMNVRNIAKLNEQELKYGIFDHRKSWHSQYKDSAYIFIGGLPYELSEGDILCVFSQYGEIVNINLVRDKKSGKSKGYGFLAYEDQKSTILAVDNFNGIKLGGRTIRVDHVEEYRRPKGDEKDEKGKFKEKEEKGCAPQTPPESEEEESDLDKKGKKKKAKKVKKKKKKKKDNKSEKRNGEEGLEKGESMESSGGESSPEEISIEKAKKKLRTSMDEHTAAKRKIPKSTILEKRGGKYTGTIESRVNIPDLETETNAKLMRGLVIIVVNEAAVEAHHTEGSTSNLDFYSEESIRYWFRKGDR